MFNRALISIKRKLSRTIILSVILLVIANLVLASVSIKSATKEASDYARESLGAEVIISQNFDEMRKKMQEAIMNGEMIDRESMVKSREEVTIETALEVTKLDHIIDYNFTVGSVGYTSNFYPLDQNGYLQTNPELNSVQITGTNNPLLLATFENGTTTIEQGSFFTGEDKNQVLISYELAEANDLVVGDTMELSLENEISTYKIVGTYISDDAFTSFMRGNNPNNTIYMTFDDALSFMKVEEGESYKLTEARYYVDDPLNVDSVVQEGNSSIAGLSEGTLYLNANDAEYEALIGPISQVGSFTNIILVVVVIAAIVILTLIIINNVKERNYEIGVLLSLGESKIKIVGQYLIELSMITLIVFSISFGTSKVISQQLGNILLEQQISSVDESQTGMGRGKFGGFAGNIEPISEIDVSVSGDDFVLLSIVGLGIIVVSSILPSMQILRYQPKQILSNRN